MLEETYVVGFDTGVNSSNNQKVVVIITTQYKNKFSSRLCLCRHACVEG